VLWFRGWIAVVGMPVALIGEGVSELTGGHSFGILWLLAGVLFMLIFAVYAHRPVVGKPTTRSQADAEAEAPGL
jgi:hypothetical protein